MNPVPNTLERLKNFTTQQTDRQPQAQLPLTHSPESKGHGVRRFKASPEGVSRFQQTQILVAFSSKDITSRSISARNVISREGIKAIFGKVSAKSSILDGIRRLSYRLSHSFERASSDFGSTRRSLIRLAGEYHQLSQIATAQNLENRQELLKQIGQKIDSLILKHSFIKGGEEKNKAIDLRMMKDFLRQESNHIRPPDEPRVQDQSNVQDPPNVQVGQILDVPPLKEVIENLPPMENKEVGKMPEAPIRPNPPEMRPYAKQLPSLEGTLKEVKKKLTSPEEPTRENASLTWANREFNVRSLKDLNVRLSPDLPLEPRPQKSFADMLITELPGFSMQSEEYGHIEQQMLLAMDMQGNEAKDEQIKAGKSLGQMLGRCIQEHIENLDTEGKKDFLLSLSTSSRESILEPILKQMGLQVPEDDEHFKTLEDAFDTTKEVLNSAYKEMLSLLPDHSDESGENITLNNVKYKRIKTLGEGGQGSVSIYEEQPGEPENEEEANKPKLEPTRIVVKRSIKEIDAPQDGFMELAKETRTHASLENHANVVGFVGAVQTPSGALLLAMDLAPNGNVLDLANNLNEAEKNGHISRESANAVRVTLLKDMVKALQQLQENAGILHLDLKMENFFIQGDGIAQVGDFGISESGLKIKMLDPKIDNTYNKAPEIQVGEHFGTRRNGAAQDLKGNYHEKNEKKLALDEQLLEQEKNALEINEKADVFALGTAAYRMFTGRQFLDDVMSSGKWGTEKEALHDFALDPSRTVSTLGTDGKDSVGFGVTALDRALNLMLHPDSTQRPSMKNLLDLSLFHQGQFSEAAVRNLIKLIADPTTPPDTLETAASQLGL